MWFETYDFASDPYVIRDPFTIPLELIRWDRDDLRHKQNLDLFLEDVVNGYRVGLKVYGPSGSGKTWLLRYIQKELSQRVGEAEAAVFYGKIPRLDPTFSAFYEFVVKAWSKYREGVFDQLAEKAGRQESQWQDYVSDIDLGSCLWRMWYKSDEKETLRLCEHWLRGSRIPVRELVRVGATVSLDRDHQKYAVLGKLIELSLLSCQTCVLIVDELENASGSLARALGDSLRDLLDSFSERFALVCSYTAEAADEFIDRGYGEFLFRRLEWEVMLDPITTDTVVSVIQVHQTAYRKGGYQGDQLVPFAEDGLRELLNHMQQERWYPGFIFPNCGVLGRLAADAGAELIDATFVTDQISEKPGLFPYLSSAPRLI
jgi:hypothetical protein